MMHVVVVTSMHGYACLSCCGGTHIEDHCSSAVAAHARCVADAMAVESLAMQVAGHSVVIDDRCRGGDECAWRRMALMLWW